MLRKIRAQPIKYAGFFLSILFAVLLILSFPNPQISILAWIAFIPLFSVIDNSSRKASFLLSYLAGIFFFGGLLYWLTHVTVPGYFVLIFYLALYLGFFGLLANIFITKLRASKSHFLLCLILPSLWVSLEFIRGIIFTGFPWGILGYTQYKSPVLIQMAGVTGAYGVSFVIIMANFVLYSYISGFLEKRLHSRGLKFQTVALLLILTSVILYGYSSLNRDGIETGLKLSVVQGNIEQARKWDPYYKKYIMGRYETLTKEAAGDEGDLIVWPETAVPGYLDEEDIGLWIKAIARKASVPLFLGAVTYEPGEESDYYFNSAVLFSSKGSIANKYDKLHLVPLGEYVPLEQYFSFVRDFIDVPIGDYAKGKEYTIFDIQSEEGRRFRYAALICFEDIFPGLVRRFAVQGADFAINMTNDAWFKESGEQMQHAQASVFRAVENRISVLRAANTGFSCYINPQGIIEDSIYDEDTGSMYIHGFKTFGLKVREKDERGTFYTRFGDLFAYLCLSLALGTVLTVILDLSPRRT